MWSVQSPPPLACLGETASPGADREPVFQLPGKQGALCASGDRRASEQGAWSQQVCHDHHGSDWRPAAWTAFLGGVLSMLQPVGMDGRSQWGIPGSR